MPSKRPIGVSNCSRTVAYAPQMRVAICAAPTLSAGSEIERPAASDSISMRQPMADAVATADDHVVERHPHIGADNRAILERHAHRIVAQADVDAWCRRAESARR